jgi:hypothetical protein
MGEKRIEHKGLVGNHKGIRSTVRYIRMWENNTEMDPKGRNLEFVN